MDDSGRSGEKDTIKEICKIFKNRNIKYLIKNYSGEKDDHTIICSEDFNFLLSLR
jgi:hypothetical protein